MAKRNLFSIMKRVVSVATVTLFGLALLWLLLSGAGITWEAMVRAISDIAGWAIICIAVLVGGNLAFGALKWLLVMRAIGPQSQSQPSFLDAMLTTTIGAILGQVMPAQLGIVLTRSLAGRVGIGPSASLNFCTTIYEQLFDVIVLFFAAVVGLVGIILHPNFAGWMILILVCSAACVAAGISLPTMILVATRLLRRISPFGHESRLASALIAANAAALQFSASSLTQLTFLSFAKYLANPSRIIIVLSALGMSAFAFPAALVFPFVQTLSFLPITPGNLGIAEWTWSAVLVSVGATMSAAALFALTARVVNFMAQSIVLVLVLSLRLLLCAWLRNTRERSLASPFAVEAGPQAGYKSVDQP